MSLAFKIKLKFVAMLKKKNNKVDICGGWTLSETQENLDETMK